MVTFYVFMDCWKFKGGNMCMEMWLLFTTLSLTYDASEHKLPVVFRVGYFNLVFQQMLFSLETKKSMMTLQKCKNWIP